MQLEGVEWRDATVVTVHLGVHTCEPKGQGQGFSAAIRTMLHREAEQSSSSSLATLYVCIASLERSMRPSYICGSEPNLRPWVLLKALHTC